MFRSFGLLASVEMRCCLVWVALIACREAVAPAAPDAVVTAIAPPDGWSVVRDGARATFEDPEHALRVVIESSDRAVAPSASDRVDAPSASDRVDAPSASDRVDAPSASDRADAPGASDRNDRPRASDRSHAASSIARVWMRVAPAMLAAPASIDEPPPEGGWDEHVVIEYSVPPIAVNGAMVQRGASAEWLRLGTRGYVVLVEGDANAIAKRDAQIAKLVDAVRPPGLAAEVLAGPVRAIDKARLDAFVETALADLDVPGAAIGVSVGGEMVYERVAGVIEKGKPERIGLNTRFLMASVTKPMTTMMEAALVDQKIVRWDQLVTEIMPSFTLGDPETTAKLQLWHMSCACTGMPRQDMEGLFEWTDVRPEARIALMKTMKPTTKLGETFQYSNPMMSAGGYIAAHAYGGGTTSLDVAYSGAMAQYVFRPIGMTRTIIPTDRQVRGEVLSDAPIEDAWPGDNAMPHALAIDGETRVMPRGIEGGVHPIAPAGGAWSTLPDMMKYAQTELGEGLAPNGTRIVSALNYRERVKPRIATGDGESYALGIDVGTYRGQRVLHHDGGSFGFGTRLWVMPDAKVAIVILTNVRNGNAKEQLPFVEAVSRRIIEGLFASAKPSAEKQLAYYVKLRHREPYTPNKDRAWVKRLVGRYHEEVLGDVEIRETPAGVIFDAGEWQSAIDVVVGANGSEQIVMLDPPFAGPGVIVGPGDPPTLIVPDQTTYTFTRVR